MRTLNVIATSNRISGLAFEKRIRVPDRQTEINLPEGVRTSRKISRLNCLNLKWRPATVRWLLEKFSDFILLLRTLLFMF